MAFVDMVTGPDGAVYGIDFANTRVVRMYSAAADVPALAPTADETPAPTDAATADGDGEVVVKPAPGAVAVCHDGRNVPELEWRRRADGSYEGTLTLSAVTLRTAKGRMTTRAWNGVIPGPLVRMAPCGTYHVRVANALGGYAAPAEGAENTMREPLLTNVHMHGLHVSGAAPGDYVFTTVEPGDSYEYT
jgi:FtsP/CotA-like multicopper oxidase with cupredoxin domain